MSNLQNQILYLSQADINEVNLSMAEIINQLETAFLEKAEGRVEMPPKPGIHPGEGDNFIHAMPAYIPSMKSAGIKWVGGFLNNKQKGLPYITGLLILNDPETGIPLSVMDCVWITAMRTGAATAVSAKYLAKNDSQSVGILGAGVQGFTNLEALKVLFRIRSVMVYDIFPAKQDEYELKVKKKWPDIEVIKVSKPEMAVRGLDIVITAGPILKNRTLLSRRGGFLRDRLLLW